MRVAAGAIARKYLRERLGVEVRGYLRQLGPLVLEPLDLATVDDNPFFCADPARVPELEAYMDALRKEGDSIGARVNVLAIGRAGGPRRAGFRQARGRYRPRNDEHQCGAGGRTRCRLCRRCPEGHRAS